jgi:hypothetical protein
VRCVGLWILRLSQANAALARGLSGNASSSSTSISLPLLYRLAGGVDQDFAVKALWKD